MLYLRADLPRCRIRDVPKTRRPQEIQTIPIEINQTLDPHPRTSRPRPILLISTDRAYQSPRCPDLDLGPFSQLHPSSN